MLNATSRGEKWFVAKPTTIEVNLEYKKKYIIMIINKYKKINIFEHNLICCKTQFNVLHMMSNVAWPKCKIYYDFHSYNFTMFI